MIEVKAIGHDVEECLEDVKNLATRFDGQVLKAIFNDSYILSTDTLDDAYLRITGMNKSEHTAMLKRQAEGLLEQQAVRALIQPDLEKMIFEALNNIEQIDVEATARHYALAIMLKISDHFILSPEIMKSNKQQMLERVGTMMHGYSVLAGSYSKSQSQEEMLADARLTLCREIYNFIEQLPDETAKTPANCNMLKQQ